MKKYIAAFLCFALIFVLAACGSGAVPSSSAPASDMVSGDVSGLLAKVTEGVTDAEMSLVNPEITDENFSWYFFIDPIDGADAAVSEPMIGSIPHFVGLLRVPDGTDPEEVKAGIEGNLDPRKWVCVEAEKTAVLRRGNLILVAMSEAASVDKAVENFKAL